MDILSIIDRKKRGLALNKEEIDYFVQGAAKGTIPDYQLSALLMAIRLLGMDDRETADLTRSMALSGHMLEPEVGGYPVDKHSTGGVGDTTTLVLAPLVAACGGKVLKMSGRGLGHTGGTLDKLESIPGMKVTLSEERFVEIVRQVGCAVVSQSEGLAPADKVLYALRDVTGTVDSIPLIVSSILSKKFASGAKAFVLDVKTGSGALMPTLEDSLSLAKALVQIGHAAGRSVWAVVTGMDEPLGSHVGNALEVKEAIDILRGRAKGPLLDVTLVLGELMLMASKTAATRQEAEKMLRHALDSGAGLRKLEEMITAQGGDCRVCRDISRLPQAEVIRPVFSPRDGYLQKTDGVALGMAAQRMGAGRASKDDVIDPAVGFVMNKRVGDKVEEGEILFTLYAKDEQSADRAGEEILSALTLTDAPCEKEKLIYAVVTPEGVWDPEQFLQ